MGREISLVNRALFDTPRFYPITRKLVERATLVKKKRSRRFSIKWKNARIFLFHLGLTIKSIKITTLVEYICNVNET